MRRNYLLYLDGIVACKRKKEAKFPNTDILLVIIAAKTINVGSVFETSDIYFLLFGVQ